MLLPLSEATAEVNILIELRCSEPTSRKNVFNDGFQNPTGELHPLPVSERNL